MGTTLAPLAAAVTVALLGLAACSADTSARPASPGVEPSGSANTPTSSTHSFVRESGGTMMRSRVLRLRYADGSETLSGDTRVRSRDQGALRMTEDVSIGADGRLERATLRVRTDATDGNWLRTVHLDAGEGTRTVHDGAKVEVASIPRGEPWTYVAPFADVSAELDIATPVGAWVMLRAAERFSAVRELSSSASPGHVVSSDQALIAEDTSRWVVLGDEAVEADAEFIRDVPGKGPASSQAAHEQTSPLRCSSARTRTSGVPM